jgi:hypothetical protein
MLVEIIKCLFHCEDLIAKLFPLAPDDGQQRGGGSGSPGWLAKLTNRPTD